MSPFTDSVAHYCKGLNVSVGCLGEECEHADGDPEHTCEPFFSWAQCDSCGSMLGGDRHIAAATGLDDDNNGEPKMTVFMLDICTDCLMFHANGEEPEEWEV